VLTIMVPSSIASKSMLRGGKCKKTEFNSVVGQYLMFTKSQHAKNEWLFFAQGKNIVAYLLVIRDVVREKK